MQKKLLGLSLMTTLATTLTVAFAAVSSENTAYALNRNITYNETVNISCPFGTEDGSNYLTLIDVNGTPTLGLSKDPELLTIEFNYNTGDFKFPLSSKYVHFKDKTITSGGTTMKYKNGICSGNKGYSLANHDGIAEYTQATTKINYLIPYYSAEQYTGWCLNCSGHKDNFTKSAEYLYNLVINKDDVADEYKPAEEVPTGTVSNLTFTSKCRGVGNATQNVTWIIKSDADESTYDGTKGIHYGTSKNAVSSLTLTTSGISGTITKIVVNASGASGTSAKLNITVDGKIFGTEKSLTSSATEYTLEGSASGEIIVSLTQSSAKKALYCKSIVVTYTLNN